VAGLRRIDPTAELVYFGEGKWLLGRVRPNALRYKAAVRIIDRALHRLAVGDQLTPEGRGRIQLAYLALQGFAPIEFYTGEPTYAIVHDFQRALWLLNHTTDAQFFHDLDAPRERAREEARADLQDDARARDAWRYMFTLSHLVTRPDPAQQPTRSGFTTIKRIGGLAA